ncbi:glycoside hydrolase family 1 protein [Dictyobacter aurantiacus]|uniref:Beta-glucosidase n=1 Tax=Dictyobacter aurantiacus TaxID=1936993 RepID=A0A401Z9W7_9CHLR|nr:family 1 glycosylhydrolase [Dictyobacter aurantiacus]GCE03596.1 beta-glucosidase [Dictyobacter aurantiacus]
MSQQHVLRFPEGFLWGTASAAYQCEGGNTNNQWYRWEQEGHILSGDTCGQAASWWEYAEHDFLLAEQMENNALRFSLEWSRIEPVEGQWDDAVLERYRAMLLDLRRLHLVPVVTLHHFTDPLWFTERGGFAHEENVRFFIRFVHHVVATLKDICSFWITLNEPNVYAFQGYLLGVFPPGEKDVVRTFQVLRNLMQAHVEAFYAIRSMQPQAQIGYCLHYRLFDPANPLSPLDRSAASVHERMFTWSALQAGETGRFTFPANQVLAPIPHAAGARDYHGVNYYTREMVRFDPRRPAEAFARRFVRPGSVRNDDGLSDSFGEIYPWGLYRVLKAIYQRTRGNKPLYITENGFNDHQDDRRPAALLAHLAILHRAIQDGIPVRGYFHWTLVDNFEWNDGWYARFGLIELDPVTQRRTPRRSASMFGEICQANAITESIVERYAPELVQSIFGTTDTHGRQLPV